MPNLLRRGEGLLKVGLDVVNVLDAHGHADHLGLDAGGQLRGAVSDGLHAVSPIHLLLVVELLVGGARGVDHERLGVAKVGCVDVSLDSCGMPGVPRCDASLTLSMNLLAAALPPLMPKDRSEP